PTSSPTRSGDCVVTASDGPSGGVKPLLDEALDLFFYAPVGLMVSSLDELTPGDLPELADKGRGRVGRVLSNARVVGHLTIVMGRRRIESELSRWRPPPTEDGPPPEPSAGVPRLTNAATPNPEPQRRTEPAPNLGIPGYETLSASHVVRRLDGLGPAELSAIYEYEARTRRRRTILHRTQQLLGHEEAPGPARWPA
ncbi:MAG: hypothetical protein ACRDVW_08665, partial [Acidimicrobiales bacterium]